MRRAVVLFEVVAVRRPGRLRGYRKLRLTLDCGHVELRSLSRAKRDAHDRGELKPPKRAHCRRCKSDAVDLAQAGDILRLHTEGWR